MNITKANLPIILIAAGVAYYLWKKNQAATVLDRRYPMAYTG
jgi:hypothetical protein